MRKQFTMYVPLQGDIQTSPVTYQFVRELGDDWLLYKTVDTNEPFYITNKCIEDFIKDGFIYDVIV